MGNPNRCSRLFCPASEASDARIAVSRRLALANGAELGGPRTRNRWIYRIREPSRRRSWTRREGKDVGGNDVAIVD